VIIVIIAARNFGGQPEIEARRACRDVEYARRVVAAEQGALRPAQDFDTLNVDQIRQGHSRPTEIDTVDIHPDRRIEAVRRARHTNAANGYGRVARIGVEGSQARRLLLDVGQRISAGLLQTAP
jgi:hypothetical protein